MMGRRDLHSRMTAEALDASEKARKELTKLLMPEP